MSFTPTTNYVYKQLTPDEVNLLKRIDLVTEFPIISQGLDTALNGVNPVGYSVEYAKFSFTPAQISNWFTNPINLIPAAGPNTVIKPINVTYNYTFVTAAYDAPIFHITYTGGGNVTNTNILNQTSSVIRDGSIGSNNALTANAGLYIQGNTANSTVGDSLLDVIFVYAVVGI